MDFHLGCGGAYFWLQLLRMLRKDDAKFKASLTLSPKIYNNQWKWNAFKLIKDIYKTHSWQRHTVQWGRWSVCLYHQLQARTSAFTSIFSIVLKDTIIVKNCKQIGKEKRNILVYLETCLLILKVLRKHRSGND